MKTLSVKQPWAYLLCAGIKNIENRTWKLPEKHRGERVLVHASGRPDKEPYMLFNDEQAVAVDNIILDVCGSYATLGAIIGSVRFMDCTINHQSIWAERAEKDPWYEYIHGECQVINPIFNWVVADPVLFEEPILGVKGKLGFWDFDLPEEYVKLINDYDNGKKDM